ncbi:MAG TPA: phage minor head protein [Verrucomicrobiae bacterium]|nr:phage minor head protein [Verrucomicrobiae bacterium]
MKSVILLNRIETGINEALIRLRAGDRRGLVALFELSLENSSEKAEKVARHDRARGAIEEIYLAGIRKTLARARSQVLHKLHRGSQSLLTSSPAGARYVRMNRPVALHNAGHPAAADFMFDLDDFTKMFFAEMREAGEEGLEISGQGLLSELGIDRKYVTPHGLIHDFVVDRENKLSQVPAEIWDTVKSALEDGVKEGMSTNQLADRIVEETFGKIDKGRAFTVARTETSAVYNTGRMDAMRQHGITHKKWLTAHDERVRKSHADAEGDGAIPIGQKFSNGLMQPGDPSGAAADVINCRCTLEAAEPPGGGATKGES